MLIFSVFKLTSMKITFCQEKKKEKMMNLLKKPRTMNCHFYETKLVNSSRLGFLEDKKVDCTILQIVDECDIDKVFCWLFVFVYLLYIIGVINKKKVHFKLKEHG